MQGIRVGYAHNTIAKVMERGHERVRTQSRMQLTLERAGQRLSQQMTLTSWDTPDGRLVRFESRMSAGGGDVVSAGDVEGRTLTISTTTLGRTQVQSIPWQPEWGGLFAPDQSLRRQPMKPGEKRSLTCLLPVMNVPGETRLEALDDEQVNLPTGLAKLLKVKSTVTVGSQPIETLYWVNDEGQTLKSLVPSIGQEAARTTKADALEQPAGGSYDLLLASTVPLTGKAPLQGTLSADAHGVKRAVYRVHLKSGEIAGLFSDCESQHVKPIDKQTIELTVVAVRPDQPAPAPNPAAISPPTDADLAANNYIQSNDPPIAQMAGHVAAGETDPWKVACGLENFVQTTVRNKNFSQAFATAAEVARSLEGDCTEHAVLLAALCRARKIPARVAFGLVYYPPAKGFAYHMWTEAWIDSRWIDLDATLGLGGIGADHLKLGDSNLSGGSPLGDLLSVIQVFGRLEIEVVEADKG